MYMLKIVLNFHQHRSPWGNYQIYYCKKLTYPHMLTQNDWRFRGIPIWGILMKKCSENIQQIYRRIPICKCDLHRCSPVNLLYIFSTHFYKNAVEWLLLAIVRLLARLYIRSVVISKYNFNFPQTLFSSRR